MPFAYAYDPLGTSGANQIVNEHQVVTPPIALDQANFIVPHMAPFFRTGLVIRTGPLLTDPALVEGTDYLLTHAFVEATSFLGLPIYGSITFIDTEYTGDVYLTYQTLGGPYTLADTSIVTVLTRSKYIINVVKWAQIVGLPAAFPPLPHPHDSADLTGVSALITAFNEMTAAILSLGPTDIAALATSFAAHIDNAATGAHVPANVGMAKATTTDIDNAKSPDVTTNGKYMTPQLTLYAIQRWMNTALSAAQFGVGDIYITAVLAMSPSDVNTRLGYGTWTHEGQAPLFSGGPTVDFWQRTA